MVEQLDLFVASGKNETNDTTERKTEIKVSAPTPTTEQVEQKPQEQVENVSHLTTRQWALLNLLIC